MAIFNSLGSNYRKREILLSLKQILGTGEAAYQQFKQELESFYQGQAVFLFNGRDAIEYCLRCYDIGRGDQVLTQAFSCSSVEEAIKRTRAEPIYFDLAQGRVSTDLKQIQQAISHSQKPRAVILQHTLGYPDQVAEIAQFCKSHQLLLVADLAQAVGAVTAQAIPLGLEADAVILSFGKDKILDAVVGGAVIFKKKPEQKLPIPSYQAEKKCLGPWLLYPFLTWKIRHLYDFYLGKPCHWFLKKLGWMQTSIKSPHQSFQSYPHKLAPLLLDRWQRLPLQLRHRSKIAHYYFSRLKNLGLLKIPLTEADIKQGTNLRFPILLESSQAVKSLLKFLAQHQIYLEDRWYRQPVDSGSVQFKSSYQKQSCSQAELLSARIINLPTHYYISLREAEKIINLIVSWLEI